MGDNIKLRDFIKSTLVEIFNGVEEARKEYEGKGVIFPRMTQKVMEKTTENNPKVTIGRFHDEFIIFIDFDVALTVEKSTESVKEGKVGIDNILVVGGDFSKNIKSAGKSLHRVNFVIPVQFKPSN